MAKNIILGTVQFGLDYGINNPYGKPDKETVFKILDHAYELGIHTIDTSEVYGNALDLIGSFQKNTGKYFSINTKLVNTANKDIKTALLNNLNKSGVDNFETCFYHNYPEYASGKHLLGQLEKLKSEKFLHKIGVTVYTNPEFEIVINDPSIDVIQLPFNLLDNISQRGELLARAQEANKRIQVRSVFLQGLFLKNPEDLPEKLIPLRKYLFQARKVAETYQLSMECLCLQYANAQTCIDEIVIGVDNLEQLISNLSCINENFPNNARMAIDEISVAETELLYPYNW